MNTHLTQLPTSVTGNSVVTSGNQPYWHPLPTPQTAIEKLEHGFVVTHNNKQYAFESLDALTSFINELFEVQK